MTGFKSWAFSIELCPESLGNNVVRVHIHLCLSSSNHPQGHLLHISRAQDLAFEESVPWKSTPAGMKISRTNLNMSFFYCLCPKIGQVLTDGNVRLYRDALVNPDWAFNMLQQCKVTVETVREVIINCAKNVPRLLANLEGYELARRRLSEDKQQEEVRARVHGAFRPFQLLQPVEQWVNSFLLDQPRYSFLVLEGPSRLGKTQYAISLSAPGRTLICDCSCAVEPDLRPYRSEDVDAILFDEAKASMVVRCKKLFQSPIERVALGQSNTDCHAYTVCLHRKRLIICTNTWTGELQLLPAADADWLRANSVHVPVTQPLWRP